MADGDGASSEFARWSMLAVALALGAGLAWRLYGRLAEPAPLHDPTAAARPAAPSRGLAANEEATVRLFENAAPSVVSITANHVRRPAVGAAYSTAQQFGSGFFWAGEYIVTNHHVVYDSQARKEYNNLSVRLRDDPANSWRADIVGIDPDNDLAALKIAVPPGVALPKPIPLGRSRDLRVGQHAFAIGNPLREEHTLTAGVVSALRRRVPSLNGRTIQDVIQTDAAINRGNSGGPLLDSSGHLIGVVMAAQGQNLGYAIPSDTVNAIVPELILRGRVERAGLGVQLYEARGLARVGGLGVYGVAPGGPADAAGLERPEVVETPFGHAIHPRDVILALDGTAVSTWDELYALLDRRKIGARVVLRVRRLALPGEAPVAAPAERDAAVTLGDRRIDRHSYMPAWPGLREDAP